MRSVLSFTIVFVSALPMLQSGRASGLQSGETLSAEDKRQILEQTIQTLRSSYIFPDRAEQMTTFVARRATRGEYDAIADPKVFADALTTDLRSVYRDLHLTLQYVPPRAVVANAAPLPALVEGVEVLEGNVGYLKLNGFVQNDANIVAAMKTLAATDALIVDLRDNMGGSPPTFLAGYFFEKPTLIAKIISRPDNATSEMWTLTVPGPLYLKRDLYVVTSPRTFSAAEAFAYHMKHLKGAVVVGQTTGGGAHRVMSVNVGSNLLLMVPFTRPINVVTGGDWEGTGVTPDVAAPRESAVAVAHLQALRRLPTNSARERAIWRLSRETSR